MFEKIIAWDNEYTGKPLILSGAPGIGKTYLSQELAKNFHNSYLYINPKNDHKLRSALLELSVQNNPNFEQFLQTYYQIPNEWLHEFLIILDDFDWYSELLTLLNQITKNVYKFRLLIINTLTPNNSLKEQCDVIEIVPLEFDEYLKAIGSEWYTEIIRAHFQTKKKIPEIVHKEMLNLFRDYLRIGGMPAAINEYMLTDSLNNLSTIHRNLYELFLSEFKRFNESSSIRLNQLLQLLPEQLIKGNKNYRYNLIRKGATHNMYRNELQKLSELHIVNKIERADFVVSDDKTLNYDVHDNQFRLYMNDCGILYSLIMASSSEFGDGTEDEISDYSDNVLYQLLAENYLLSTLKSRNQNVVFWESGSLAKIDFLSIFDNSIMPIEVKYQENKKSKSLHVFKQKLPVISNMKFGRQNFSVDEHGFNCPIYSLFCL